jgi:hypothetical protein
VSVPPVDRLAELTPFQGCTFVARPLRFCVTGIDFASGCPINFP